MDGVEVPEASWATGGKEKPKKVVGKLKHKRL